MQLKNFMTPKNFNFQKTFYSMPLSFSKFKKWSSYDLLYVVTSESESAWSVNTIRDLLCNNYVYCVAPHPPAEIFAIEIAN